MTELSSLTKRQLQDLFNYLEEYRVRFRTCIHVPDDMSFGVEIEFADLLLSKAKEEIKKVAKEYFIYVDESVTDFPGGEIIGGEATSPILHDKNEDWLMLHNVCEVISNMGGVATEATGGHIHIGAQVLGDDLKNLERLVKTWCVFEHIIYRFGYANSSRARSKILYFAGPISNMYISLCKRNKNFFKDISTTKEYDFGKRMGISFKNYHFLSGEEEVNNTIEVRCPNGTIDPITIQNNVNFFMKLMLYVSSSDFDEKRINRMFSHLIDRPILFPEIDIKQTLLLADLIFRSEEDKLNFLSQYIKCEDYVLLRK